MPNLFVKGTPRRFRYAHYPATGLMAPGLICDIGGTDPAVPVPFHKFLAERYRPDILVPFIEPYGAFTAVTGKTLSDMEPVLSKTAGWIDEHGRGREHWVFEFGQSPLTMGGERAQSHFVQWIMGWGSRQPNVQGACIFALRDYEERMGLISSTGRKRMAFHDCQRLTTL